MAPNHDPDLQSLSHDMKSPLTGIQMVLHLLSEQKVGTLNEKQASMVSMAKSDCHRLVEVVKQHLDTDECLGDPCRSSCDSEESKGTCD